MSLLKSYPCLLPFIYSTLVMLAVVESIKLVGLQNKTKRSFNNTRKLLHVLAGTIFIALWSKFPNSDPTSAYWAAAVPFGMTAKFVAVALGLIPSKSDVLLMSRTGSRLELLKGPALYGLSIFFLTLLDFKSIAASSAILSMCFGDGFAEVFGVFCSSYRLLGRRLDWNVNKSWAGFAACCAFSSLGIFLSFYLASVYDWVDWVDVVKPNIGFREVVKISCFGGCIAGLVESLPIKDVDNVLLPLSVYIFVKSGTTMEFIAK